MEGDRFDELTRAIAGTETRRVVVRRIAGAVGGGLLAAVGLRKAEAALCRGAGRPCRKATDCCSEICNIEGSDRHGPHGHCACPDDQRLCRGKCLSWEFCCDDSDCETNEQCRNGHCACRSGQTCGSGPSGPTGPTGPSGPSGPSGGTFEG